MCVCWCVCRCVSLSLSVCVCVCVQVVLDPLIVPPVNQPLTRCGRFEWLWSSHDSSAAVVYSTAGAGGVDVMGSDKGITFWRPQVPMGYASVGDVLTAGRCREG